MNCNIKLSTITSAIRTYATHREINRRVIGTFFSRRIFSGKGRKTVQVFFVLKGRTCG